MLLKHPSSPSPIKVRFLPDATFRDLAKAAIAEFGLRVHFLDLQLRLGQEKPLSALEPLEAQGVTAGCVVHVCKCFLAQSAPPPTPCLH